MWPLEGEHAVEAERLQLPGPLSGVLQSIECRVHLHLGYLLAVRCSAGQRTPSGATPMAARPPHGSQLDGRPLGVGTMRAPLEQGAS